MALFEEQITDTLETGAPSIKYEGDEGPQDPRQEQMLAQLKEEYMQYVFEMKELQEPVMSFEEWYQAVYQASKMGVQAPQEDITAEEVMMREPAAYGGIMDTESGRRMYGIGSFFKKITRPIKKIAKGAKKIFKSPVGKIGLAALLAGPALGALTGKAATGSMIGMGPLHGATKVPWYKKGLMKGIGTLAKKAIQNPKTLAKIGIGAASALPLLGIGTQKQQEVVPDMGKLGSFDFDYGKMIRDVKGAKTTEDFADINTKYGTDLVEDESVYLANGGRIPFALGAKADFAIEDVMTGGMEDEIGGITGIMRQADLQRKGNVGQFYAADGGRIGYAGGNYVGSKQNVTLSDEYNSYLKEGGNMSFSSFVEMLREDRAQGGRIGYADGTEWTADTGLFGEDPKFSKLVEDAVIREENKYWQKGKEPPMFLGDKLRMQMWNDYKTGAMGPAFKAHGGRIGAQEGGIMDLGGMEKDYRNTGGFVELGAEEKADDVPARLSKNEFVMTADAVRGAGDGDIDKGASIMENMMKELEQKGQEDMKMAGPDWYIKRIEHLMFLGYSYDEAAEIALDNNKYDEIIGDPMARKQGAQDMFEVSERLSEVV